MAGLQYSFNTRKAKMEATENGDLYSLTNEGRKKTRKEYRKFTGQKKVVVGSLFCPPAASAETKYQSTEIDQENSNICWPHNTTVGPIVFPVTALLRESEEQ